MTHVDDERGQDSDVETLRVAAMRAAASTFIDAHNAGDYINSYTIKLNPGMEGVLQIYIYIYIRRSATITGRVGRSG